MSKNTSIALGEHFNQFIAAQVSRGRYGSASEVVRAGLRLLEDREVQLKSLRDALIEGEESGSAEPFDNQAFLADVHTRHADKR
ncbi:type II toxin-antitoxin system ParD family antitoxin [Hyphomicrobium sp.]|uniref:type II toxin-antitoxin system ParD family antitoxin n=1 Tax=Hyphomicrobium sp. TaxID=82 RepID=UPI003F6F82D1